MFFQIRRTLIPCLMFFKTTNIVLQVVCKKLRSFKIVNGCNLDYLLSSDVRKCVHVLQTLPFLGNFNAFVFKRGTRSSVCVWIRCQLLRIWSMCISLYISWVVDETCRTKRNREQLNRTTRWFLQVEHHATFQKYLKRNRQVDFFISSWTTKSSKRQFFVHQRSAEGS